jgi:hypothetical protein
MLAQHPQHTAYCLWWSGHTVQHLLPGCAAHASSPAILDPVPLRLRLSLLQQQTDHAIRCKTLNYSAVVCSRHGRGMPAPQVCLWALCSPLPCLPPECDALRNACHQPQQQHSSSTAVWCVLSPCPRPKGQLPARRACRGSLGSGAAGCASPCSQEHILSSAAGCASTGQHWLRGSTAMIPQPRQQGVWCYPAGLVQNHRSSCHG